MSTASWSIHGILKTSCISNGSFNAHENKKIIEEDITRAKLNPVKDSILVSRMNTPQLVGEVGYIYCDYPNLFIPDRLWLIQTRDKLLDSAKWLNYQLTTPKLKNALTSIATGTSGSMKNIAQPNFLNLEVHTPAPQEQTKIANFLTAVDEKITQLTNKHELLTHYKNGVMQKIFSRQLRFKDDCGGDFPEWEEMEVGEVFKVTRGNVLAMPLVSETKTDTHLFPVYSSQTKNNGLSGYYNDYLYENSITWTTDGANAGDVNFRSGKFYCTNVCGVLINEDGQANACIAAMINAVSRKYVSYVGNPKLMNGVMSKIAIEFPSVKEQTKISNFLTAIDVKISATKAQLDTVKQYKQGLLQQMFV